MHRFASSAAVNSLRKAIAPFVAIVFLLVSTDGFAQHPLPVNDNDWAESEASVFLEEEVTQIFVTMDERLLDEFMQNPYLDTYVDAAVRIVNSVLDETHLNVGIRPRGNSQRGSMKFPWKLSFNEFVPGRKFHGIEKMNLASESTDPSMARESLAYEIFRSFGVASGRTNHVWLTINDGSKVQGVFNNIEQVDEEFVQAWFGKKDGDLYKCRWKDQGARLLWTPPGDAATYRNLGDYEEKITDSFQRLADFIDFVCNSDDPTFNAGIGGWINVDSFLRAQAVDMYLGQWDGLWIFPNNYYLYWDTESQRFEYIPWDLDHSMGMDYWFLPYFWGTDWARRPFAGWGDSSEASKPGNGNGPPLIDRLLKIPEYESQLARNVKEIAAYHGHPSRLTPSVERIFNLLAPLAYTGSFSGSTMENGYQPQDFLDSWEFPSDYSSFNNPATWGVLPFLRTRSDYVRSNYPDPSVQPSIYVNEIVAKNETGITDEAGEYEDWIEIFNNSSQPVDLSGFFLSNRYADTKEWEIPAGTVVPPNGYILIWCDGEVSQGPLHASFSLDKNGEGVYLFSPESSKNVWISSLVYPALNADQAWGRLPDAGFNTAQLAFPTPLAANQTGSLDLVKEGFVPDAQVLHALGATPDGRVAFLWSRKAGSFPIGSGIPCAGTTLSLGSPVFKGSVQKADATGVASVTIQPNVAPAGILVQCLDVSSCEVSNVIEF
jgi:hypothetical protein